MRQLEVKFKHKDGTPYHALLSLRPVTIQDTPHLQAVVEDDDHVADVVTACLQRHHVIYRAKDGGGAVGEKFKEIELDAAFVD